MAPAGDILTDPKLQEQLGTYDIVIANIVADVIIGLSGFVKKFMKKDGTFICSGIILERLDEVTAALEKAGMQILSTKQQDDWCRVTAALA